MLLAIALGVGIAVTIGSLVIASSITRPLHKTIGTIGKMIESGDLSTRLDASAKDDHAGWFERMQPSFGLALDAFISSLEGKPTPYPNLRDGLTAQLIAEAAVESLHTNKPVKIEYWQPA